MYDLLITGGQADPNIQALWNRANHHHLKVLPVLLEKRDVPAFQWSIGEHSLAISDKPCHFRAAFSRRNVFHDWKPEDTNSAEAWFATLQGYLLSYPDIRILNRASQSTVTNKLAVLVEAKKLGLMIPETMVTNQQSRLPDEKHFKEFIAKPVAGGGYCTPLQQVVDGETFRNGISAMPAIVQRRIPGEDIRIYRIGEQWFGFRLTATALDYRQDRHVKIKLLKKLPQQLIRPLAKLMDAMHLEWGAADFKENNDAPVFLEVNSHPMFSRFDQCANGKICDAILRTICGMDI